MHEQMYYTGDEEEIAKMSAANEDVMLGADHPRAYLPDPGLIDAVNVALVLRRPLLLTGDPGTGKTQLAYSVAWQLKSQQKLEVKSARVEKFETKSTSVARDLFYTFDVLGRFHAAQTEGSRNNVDYITYNALGNALLNSLPKERIAHLVPPGYPYRGCCRSVVLIDEIDKAPRDFPNDLLNELDQLYFRIPELGGAQVASVGSAKPIVIITSNSEKSLPDPFLRRCIYYNIPFPSPERLKKILLARLPILTTVHGSGSPPMGSAKKTGTLLDGALEFYDDLQKANVTRRKISAAELLQWLTFMVEAGASPKSPLIEAATLARRGLPALAKDIEEQKSVRRELDNGLPAGEGLPAV